MSWNRNLPTKSNASFSHCVLWFTKPIMFDLISNPFYLRLNQPLLIRRTWFTFCPFWELKRKISCGTSQHCHSLVPLWSWLRHLRVGKGEHCVIALCTNSMLTFFIIWDESVQIMLNCERVSKFFCRVEKLSFVSKNKKENEDPTATDDLVAYFTPSTIITIQKCICFVDNLIFHLFLVNKVTSFYVILYSNFKVWVYNLQ